MFENLLLAAGGVPTPNGPIIPHDINEVIWGSISFTIVISLIIWKGGPAIKGMWNGRIERLSTELSDAETARSTAEAKLADVEHRIANADAERDRIRSDAAQNAVVLKDQIAARAVKDADDVRRRGVADVESSKQQVAVDLGAELADLAVGAAEAVVARNLDVGTQDELIERYITNVGSGLAGSAPGGQR